MTHEYECPYCDEVHELDVADGDKFTCTDCGNTMVFAVTWGEEGSGETIYSGFKMVAEKL